jgi:hypothetical protein
MAEDWRVSIELPDAALSERVVTDLHEHIVEPDGPDGRPSRIAVSFDGAWVFLYADTRETADVADQVLHAVLAARGIDAESTMDHWHPIEEAWEDAGVPLPSTDDERRAERERLEAEEARESQATGDAAWEVRVELKSPADAERLADRLVAEGNGVVRRSNFLLVGANNESEAEELAATVTALAPPGTTVHKQPGGALAWEAHEHRPFAIFGGLAG